MKRIICILCILSLFHVPLFGQQGTVYLNVGDTLPEHTFTDLANYPKSTARISDFKGKWLILDIWGYTCSACIASFPEMNKLSQQFKDKMQLIMVGATKNGWGNTKKIEKITKTLYKRLEHTYQLKFTVAFDSIIYLKHNIGALPHILIVDPSGIVRAKTMHIDSIQIAQLLEGKIPEFERQYSASEPRSNMSYNKALPVLTNGQKANGGNDTTYVYRSLLVLRNDNMPTAQFIYDLNKPNSIMADMIESGCLEIFEQPMEELYRLAYFGVSVWGPWNKDYYGKFSLPLLDERAEFPKSCQFDTIQQYVYSLKLPKDKSSKFLMMRSLQQDLERYFGYKARVENRKMRVLFARIRDQQKVNTLITKADGPVHQSDDFDGILKVRNMEFSDFIRNVSGALHNDIPILDDTGIHKKINIDFKANLYDINDTKKSFIKYGIELVEGVKEMKVIVLEN